MMTLWCLFGSPLMIGAELTKLDERTLELLTNRRVLAMLTPECKPWQLCLDDKKAIWRAGNEKTGAKYVALFNLSEEESEMTVSLAEAEMEAGACLTELWTGERATVAQGVLHANIPAHGCAVYETGLL